MKEKGVIWKRPVEGELSRDTLWTMLFSDPRFETYFFPGNWRIIRRITE